MSRRAAAGPARPGSARAPPGPGGLTANTIAAEVGLSPGTARRVLLNHVRALQNGHQKEPS